MNTINQNNGIATDLVTAERMKVILSYVSNVGSKNAVKPLSDTSRVNEQEVFAATVIESVNKQDPKIAREFWNKFEELTKIMSKKDPSNAIFEAARRTLRGMRRSGSIAKEIAKGIKKYSLGKSQLDSKRDTLSTENVTGKRGDTAFREVKTAVAKFEKNVEATEEEFAAFKINNAERRAQKRSKDNLAKQIEQE